jgi:hypothetical protein
MHACCAVCCSCCKYTATGLAFVGGSLFQAWKAPPCANGPGRLFCRMSIMLLAMVASALLGVAMYFVALAMLAAYSWLSDLFQ